MSLEQSNYGRYGYEDMDRRHYAERPRTSPTLVNHGNVVPTDRSETVAESVYLNDHSKIKLPDGQNSILIDIGFRINIIGANTEKHMREQSTRLDKNTAIQPKPTPSQGSWTGWSIQ